MRSTRSDDPSSASSAVYRDASVAAPTGAASAWWLAIRPRTLGASTVPVAVGLALAARQGPLDLTTAAVTLATALCLQIASNLANDYYDFVRGVDTAERLGPPRATERLLAPAAVRRGLTVVLVLAAAAGVYLVTVGGWPILAIGAAALVCAVAYSAGPWPLSWYGLGDALAFSFFGVVAVGGTVLLQGGKVGLPTLVVSLPVACLVTALLVVNNLRDIPTDRTAGKRTLAVRLGEKGTRIEYTALVGAAFLGACVIAAWQAGGALLALLALPLAMTEIARVWARTGAALNASLVATARLHVIFGLLLTVGLLL